MKQAMNYNYFDEIINRIKEQIRYYEVALINNNYFLGLANGDAINLTFPKNNISHLLGIHTEQLKAASIIKTDLSSYETLKKLVNSELTYYDIKNTNHSFDINTLFSEHIDSKLEIFQTILKIRTDDIYCIIKYCSDRTYTTGEEKEKADYFIIRKHDKKFSVLGIIKKDNKNNYVPVTARLYNSYDELHEFLNKVAKNQEITYPYSFRIDNYEKDYQKKVYVTLEEKYTFNITLKDMAFKYKAIPSTNKDFIVILEKSLNNKQKNNNNSSILNTIKDCIINNVIIDKEEIKQILDDEVIPQELDSLIDASNDLICSNNNESTNNSYSTIQNENKNLKEELLLLKKQLLELKTKNTELEEENSSLKEENSKGAQKIKILTDAFENIKNI